MKAGDVVRLKSGGPKMTVERIRKQHVDPKAPGKLYAACVFFEGSELKREEVAAELLELDVNPDGKVGH